MSEAPQETNETPQDPREANLSEQEKESLRIAREGLAPADPYAPKANTPQRPENVPEKFWDAEKGEIRVDALTQSYAELEAKLSGKTEAPAEEGEEEVEVDVNNGKIEKKTPAEGEEEAANESPLTGLIEAAASEFTSGGQFTEETAAKLAEAGIPAEVQSVYLAGLQALQAQQTATVQGYVGGEENYNAMAQWAGRTLSDAELDAFNAALDNPALAENAVTGLYARYTKARPSEGRKVTPQNGASDAGDIFKSRAEFTQALQDPRYRTDAAYQREVTEKLRRTRASGASMAS